MSTFDVEDEACGAGALVSGSLTALTSRDRRVLCGVPVSRRHRPFSFGFRRHSEIECAEETAVTDTKQQNVTVNDQGSIL